MKKQWGVPDLGLMEKVYALYQEAVTPFDAVCHEKCSSCCTCNVTMTSLEAALMISRLSRGEKKYLQTRISDHFPVKRYIPKMSENGYARMCMQGQDTPSEENNPSWGKCPLLIHDLCCFYAVRPFGCRVLMSQTKCSEKGYAQIPPIVLTINTLFMQIIEQLDQTGFFGNLSDMLTLFLSTDKVENLSDYHKIQQDSRFVQNEKISVLMVPPEHRQSLGPLIKKLSDLMNIKET